MSSQRPLSIAVFISGNGSNLQVLIDQKSKLGIEIKLVVSNCKDAFGLIRAQKAGIPTITLEHKQLSRDQYGQALKELLDTCEVEYIILAGFMKILSSEFVQYYKGKIINIHPSLLPKYKGLNTHRRVLENKEAQHGATVHFVTEQLDDGANIIQAVFDIKETDTEKELMDRVHQLEHVIYPMALDWLAQGRLTYHNDQAWLDNQLLPSSGLLV